MNSHNAIHTPGYVLVEGDRIVGVGDGPPPAHFVADDVIDATHMAVIPGLVNAHTHLFQTFVRGLADDKPLMEWLEAAIWPVQRLLNDDDMYLSSLLGLVENIRSGVTSVIDHQYVHTHPAADDAVCRAAQASGLRFVLARGWSDVGMDPAFLETPQRIVAEMERLLATWHGAAGGRIRIEFGPDIPWGSSDDTMRRTAALAREWGLGTHIHVAESLPEVESFLAERGQRHAEWLASLGGLGRATQLVHCVWLSDGEIDRIVEHDAVVVHCPVSNMYLASGVAPIPLLRARGVTVALATDGPGSNNAQDMLETLKFTACLHKVHTLDAMALLPEDALFPAAALACTCTDGVKSICPPCRRNQLHRPLLLTVNPVTG